MKNNDEVIDIMHPSSTKITDDYGYKLCKAFIKDLVDSNSQHITLKINNKLKLVESNTPNVKTGIDMFMKAGMLEQMKAALVSLLYKDENNNKILGALKCLISNQVIIFTIEETCPSPDFS